jgi:hypothetical protein
LENGRVDERVSRGQASERAVCVCEAVSVEKGARRHCTLAEFAQIFSQTHMARRALKAGALGGVAATAMYATDATLRSRNPNYVKDRQRVWALCEATSRAATLVGVVG